MTQNGDWSKEDLNKLLKQFGSHLVSLCGTYRYLDVSGNLIEEEDEQFYSYTAFIISYEGNWFLITAGHVLKELEEKSNHSQISITGRVLVDYFGAEAKSKAPIPFDVLNEPRIFIDDENLGLDVGVVYLRDYYRNLLKSNKVVPAPFRKEKIEDYKQFYGFSIVGFPDEKSESLTTSEDPQAGGQVMPVLVPIDLNVEDPRDNKPYSRLTGKVIEMGSLSSIEGISGGPLIGYREEGGQTLYEVIGLQSRWKGQEKTTFACPILPFLEVLSARQSEIVADQ